MPLTPPSRLCRATSTTRDGDAHIAKAMVRCSPRRGAFGLAVYYNDVCYILVSSLALIRRNRECFFYLSSGITGAGR